MTDDDDGNEKFIDSSGVFGISLEKIKINKFKYDKSGKNRQKNLTFFGPRRGALKCSSEKYLGLLGSFDCSALMSQSLLQHL